MNTESSLEFVLKLLHKFNPAGENHFSNACFNSLEGKEYQRFMSIDRKSTFDMLYRKAENFYQVSFRTADIDILILHFEKDFGIEEINYSLHFSFYLFLF